MKRSLTLFVTLGAALLAGGIAYATIPDAHGVIHGCYSKTGALRVVDAPTQSCAKNETALDWNTAGPTGTQGPTGATGPSGPSGASHAWSASAGMTPLLPPPYARFIELASFHLPAGNYVVTATGTAEGAMNPSSIALCKLQENGTTFEESEMSPIWSGSPGSLEPYAMVGTASLPTDGYIALACEVESGNSDVWVDHNSLVVQQVDALN